MDIDEFRDPGAECRGVTLWMLNDRLETGELERQLEGIADAGWGAIITRTFDGLLTPYLSDEWMDLLERMTEGAASLGLGVWFQAGYMTGGIPRLREEHKHDVLVARPTDEPPEEGDAQVAEDGEFVYRERRMEHFLDLINPDAVRSYLLQAYEEPYFERFGDEFGRTIKAIWVDEPRFRPPALPWAESLHQEFESRWGYPVREHAPCLFRRVGPWRRVRHHYWRTVLEMLVRGYFEPVHDWCAEHGVEFSGHLMGEDTLVAQIAWTAACMPLYEYMQVPGIDHLTMSLNWSHGQTAGRAGDLPFILTPKQCSSAANQTGQAQILAEMFGVSTEGITFEDRKWIADWFALLGINQPCMHGTFYSIRGRRKRRYVPHLSYQQPWWPDNRVLTDHEARRNYALRQGDFCADTLVLHPVESGFCLHDASAYVPYRGEQPPDDILDLNRDVVELSVNLMRAHRGFEYGDETLMDRHGEVIAEGLRIGRMTYRAVILPSLITLRQTTVDLLTEFMDAGGTVLSAGSAPDRVDGEETAALSDFNERLQPVENKPEALRAALGEAAPTDRSLRGVAGDADRVWIHERRDGNRRIFFLANTGREETVEVELRIAAAGKVAEWDMDAGETRPIPQRPEDGGVTVPLTFPPAGSHLLVFEEGEAPVEIAAPSRETTRSVDLGTDWELERSDPNALKLDFCRVRKGEGSFSEAVPVLALKQMLGDYEGPVTLRFAFRAEVVPQRVHVVVEQADQYQIIANGQEVAYDGLPYFRDRTFLPVDISDHVREGENVVELSRRYQPLEKPQQSTRFENVQGVELEPIYVTGDFAVRGKVTPGPERPRSVRYGPDFAVVEEAARGGGDLLADGYPFYAGKIVLSRQVELEAPKAEEQVLLRLPELEACLARVRVNGRPAGTVGWPPYCVEVADLIAEGGNTVEIELTNTLRNLIGPHHRPQGETEETWGEWVWVGQTADEQEGQWWETRDPELNDWTDDYFLVPFGLPQGATLEYRS